MDGRVRPGREPTHRPWPGRFGRCGLIRSPGSSRDLAPNLVGVSSRSWRASRSGRLWATDVGRPRPFPRSASAMEIRTAMGGILSRQSSRRSIGIVADDRRIAICVLASSAQGGRPVACDVHDLGKESPAELLGRVLQPYLPAGRSKRAAPGPWVQVGIPDGQAFQAVVPITQANRSADGADLLPRGRAGDQRPRRRIESSTWSGSR